MKRIGLLGGMSWESSIDYERIINEEVRDRLGGMHSADLVIRSFDFAVIEHLQALGDWTSACDLLIEAALGLEQAGAEVLVLCTNTMHRVADELIAATTVPLLHIADATAAAIGRSTATRIGLLGTRFTMEQPFYRDRLSRLHGLDVRVPSEADRELVHSVIYDELVRGVIRPESRSAFLEVIGRLVADGCDGIIAGCTEIELLVGPEDVDVAYFATTRIHALAAVDVALG